MKIIRLTLSFALMALTIHTLLVSPGLSTEKTSKLKEKKSLSKRPPGRHFLRHVVDGDNSQLQTSIVRYERPDGTICDLIGVVHIGEKSYYKILNEKFKKYDALLYELVSDGEPPPPPGKKKARATSGVSGIQLWMKRSMALAFQLEEVDYSPKNFVHADMDPETFFKKSKERGESLLAMMMKSMKQEAARQAQGKTSAQITLFDLIRIFLKKDKSLELKKVMAKQLQDIDSANELLEGEKGSVLLTERNKVAIEVLEKSLKKGKRKIGIFYGAAHLPDLEQRLIGLLGFKRTGAEWLVAWDMTKSPKDKIKKLVPKARF